MSRLRKEKTPLDIVNVCTLLHRIGRYRLEVPGDVVKFLVATFKTEECGEDLNGQGVGNALYGLQSLDDSKDVRELVAILASKVQNCRGKLNSQSVGNALYGLQGLTDSEEARQMVAALAPKVCMAFFLRRGPEGD